MVVFSFRIAARKSANLRNHTTRSGGRKQLHIIRALNKDTAYIVEIRRDQQLSGYDIHLPDSLPLRTLEGVVLGPDGKPAANASVQFRNIQTGDRDYDSANTRRDGKFSIQGIEGQTYELIALVFDEEGFVISTPVQIKFGPTNVLVQLTVSPSEK